MMTRLVTDRLMMRRAQPSDFEYIHVFASCFEVIKMIATWPCPSHVAFTKSRCVAADASHGMVGPVFHKQEFVGTMGAMNGQLDYMFLPEHWGGGFATEIGQTLINHVWSRYDWQALTAGAYTDNEGSIRVLEKLGFAELDPGLGYCTARDTDPPMRNFKLLRPPCPQPAPKPGLQS